jgi:hypothetical protein
MLSDFFELLLPGFFIFVVPVVVLVVSIDFFFCIRNPFRSATAAVKALLEVDGSAVGVMI